MSLAYQPIGIFDSGIGGLTVAQAVKKQLPEENIIYFGDTAHLPYGDKSQVALQSYAIKVCEVLLRYECKVVLIACNSASAAAYDLVKEYLGSRAQVLNVIDPVIERISKTYAKSRLGLIGTRQTVQSRIYEKKIHDLNQDISLFALETPLLAPMIEEGFYQNRISEQIIHAYLEHPGFKTIDALILACTHYPLIQNQIHDFFNGQVAIMDSATTVALALEALLNQGKLVNPGDRGQKDRFLVSDYTRSFEESSRVFFGQEIQLEKYPIWD